MESNKWNRNIHGGPRTCIFDSIYGRVIFQTVRKFFLDVCWPCYDVHVEHGPWRKQSAVFSISASLLLLSWQFFFSAKTYHTETDWELSVIRNTEAACYYLIIYVMVKVIIRTTYLLLFSFELITCLL